MSLCRRKVSAACTPRNVYTTIDATGYARRSRSLAKASLFARCRSADAATRHSHHKRCQNAHDGQGNLGLAAHRKRVARRTSCSPIVLATRSPPTAECCCWESPLPACTGAYGLSTSHACEPFHSHTFARGSSMDTPKRQSLARRALPIVLVWCCFGAALNVVLIVVLALRGSPFDVAYLSRPLGGEVRVVGDPKNGSFVNIAWWWHPEFRTWGLRVRDREQVKLRSVPQIDGSSDMGWWSLPPFRFLGNQELNMTYTSVASELLASEHTDSSAAAITDYYFGWPFSAARSRVVHDQGSLGRGLARKSEEAIVLSETPGSTQPLYTLSTPSRKRERLAIPSKILWPGFLANTVFGACLLWSCLALVRFARRTLRQKQGLCGHCGYPASGAVCSECGERNLSRGRLDSPPTTSPHAP